VDNALGQVNEPRSSRARQYREQIVGLYPIVASCGLNDRVVDLDEFFRVAGTVIFTNLPRLELVSPNDLLSDGARARKPPLPDGVASCSRERHEGVNDLP
jgi:hypothetical protein